MATSYNVYANNSAGGPVDYSTVVANVSTLTYTTSALSFPSDTTFAIRATDGTHEESNVDARVRIVLDSSGNDVGNIPNPVIAVSAIPTAGGSIRVDWAHVPSPTATNPTGFHVWATVGGVVNYAASPDATVAWLPGLTRYSAVVSGLTGGAAYSVGVRAYSASGDDGNTILSPVTPLSSGPGNVDGLAGSATHGTIGTLTP